MALVQCVECDKKMIEDDEMAILECPFCGCPIIRVLEEKE